MVQTMKPKGKTMKTFHVVFDNIKIAEIPAVHAKQAQEIAQIMKWIHNNNVPSERVLVAYVTEKK